jgi:CTP synthase
MENQFYLEAIGQMRSNLPDDRTYLIHTTLVPYLETTGEQKTKPTQHSVRDLRESGLEPDTIVGRSKKELTERTKEKISLTCGLKQKQVISDPNLETVYELPLHIDQQQIDEVISEKLGLPGKKKGLEDWRNRVENLKNDSIGKIAICGKYTDIDDSYASVEEALKHAAAEEGGKVDIDLIGTEEFDPEKLEEYDGVVIPGGFGKRGIQGKIDAIQYCRENDKPILGLCYGLQLMVVEFARNELGIDAASGEFAEEGQELVVKQMPDQENIEQKGGTMRLGAYTAEINGKVAEIYGDRKATERHRHRYEVNPEYHEKLEQNGLKISGKTINGELAEYIEIPEHPFFIGTQAHPEFTSTFEEPNPLYHAFIKSVQS